jgi:predicted phosphoribosyltransferase
MDRFIDDNEWDCIRSAQRGSYRDFHQVSDEEVREILRGGLGEQAHA